MNIDSGADIAAQSMLPAGAAVEPGLISQLPAGQSVGGIEILVQMAVRNEIDPKNIDIIDVTDRFLKAIAAAPKENLRRSGKILFHASVLLRMKAEALLTYAQVDDFLDFDADGSPILFDPATPAARRITLNDLEGALVRRAHVPRRRKVTLEELIDALKDAERIDGERVRRYVEPRIQMEGYLELNDVDDILDVAQDEDIETIIGLIEQILEDTLGINDSIAFTKLVKKLAGRGDWVDVFLSMLFLSNAGKIDIKQDSFWGPVFLERKEPPVAALS